MKLDGMPIKTEYIRLDAFLKLCGAVDTGGQAKLVIQSGHVTVNGEVCPMRGKKLYVGDKIIYGNTEYEVLQSCD